MYDQHYGLTGRPFQLTPDPRFWFDTATHKKAMAYLGYGLSQGEGFIVITGDIGAGKTTLVGHLVDTVDADRLNVVRIVSTQIAADDLLRTVCAGLSVDAAGLTKAQMLGAIERGLHAVARGGRRTLLIVDEAQALPVDSLEELRMLSNFQAGGHALLQIFLLGQPEFREKLADVGLEQMRQRVIAMHHLGPMEADELEPYLVHRLTVVGWTGRPRFKTDALATIYAWSGGIPRRINQLVSRVLMYGAIEGIDIFTATDVMAAVNDLDSDGMTGGVTPVLAPQIVRDDAPVAAAAVAAPTAVASVAGPVAAAPVIEPPMEWPFVTKRADPVAPSFAPAPLSVTSAPTAPAAESRRIVIEPLAAENPAPKPLFDRLQANGRHSLLTLDESPPEPVAPEPVAPEPVAAVAPTPVADLDLARRLVEMDRRMEDQDAALRRVLTLLVDWVEGGSRPDISGLRDKVA